MELASSGFDSIDLEAATQHGIVVNKSPCQHWRETRQLTTHLDTVWLAFQNLSGDEFLICAENPTNSALC
jgi:hypothetical protein